MDRPAEKVVYGVKVMMGNRKSVIYYQTTDEQDVNFALAKLLVHSGLATKVRRFFFVQKYRKDGTPYKTATVNYGRWYVGVDLYSGPTQTIHDRTRDND